ncbi:MAG: flagellar hook-basal body complex protein FliE [Verrucomicrobiota bacterium]
MDPLSAIRQYMTPYAGAPAAGKAAEQLLNSSQIPAGELQKLGAAAGLPPTPGLERSSDAVPTIRINSAGNGEAFSSLFGKLVDEVNARQMVSKDAVQGLLNGDQVALHQAMIAMEEASVSFQLMVEVRNKLLESYQELMRMQI